MKLLLNNHHHHHPIPSSSSSFIKIFILDINFSSLIYFMSKYLSVYVCVCIRFAIFHFKLCIIFYLLVVVVEIFIQKKK